MLTILETLIILLNIPVLIWALLPIKRVPRWLDFMPSAAVVLLILHLFLESDPLRLRLIPLYIITIIIFLVTIIRIFKPNPNQPKRRVLASIVSIFGIIVFALSVMIPTVVLPFYSLPEASGSFSVGTVTCDFKDETRMETLSAEPGAKREIPVQFWYPIDKTTQKTSTDTEAAAVSGKQQNYPVLIFSHGAYGMRKSNLSTFRELASHGYIVASIDHTYHAFFSSFADGRAVPISMNFLNELNSVQNNALSPKDEYECTSNWLKLRVDDVKLVLDRITSEELEEDGTLLKGHMDLNSIGLFGHSLGGATAAEVCRERKDVKAAIVIDGTMIGDIKEVFSDGKRTITEESFEKPLMLMYNSSFEDQEYKVTAYKPNISVYNNATNTAYSLSIRNSGHLNFTDLPRISPFISGKLGVGSIDATKCIKIMNEYTLAFFDRHLKGIASPLLDGTKSKYEEVVFEKRN